MKILVLTTTEKKNHKIEFGHELTFKTIDSPSPSVLKESAKFAEEQECELLAVVPEGNDTDILKDMLEDLPDKDLPTALVTAFQAEYPEPETKVNRTILMLQLLTGEKICEFRNDLRIYPVKLLNYLPTALFEDPFFHVRILIKASKGGYKIISSEDRSGNSMTSKNETPSIGFFFPILLKTLVPWPHKRLCPRNFQKEKVKEFFLHPLKFIKFLLKENATPGGLAMAAATGMFLGTLPLLGIHTAAIIYVSIKLRLNKMLSVNISHLCMPPFVPFGCIQLGHYMLHGRWLTIDTLNKIFKEANVSGFGWILLDWILGALILAPANAILFGGLTYIISASIKSGIKTDK